VISKSLRVVGLVACCGPKLGKRAPAALLYTSDLFKKSVDYLLSKGIRDIAILSAKHGLVQADQELSPYDKTLAKMNAKERAAWSRKTKAQIANAYPWGTHFVVLAGKLYLSGIPEGYSFEDPLKGMGIGDRLRFLKENTAKKGKK